MIEIRPIRHDDSIEELTELLHDAYSQLGSRGLNFTAVDQTVDTTMERIGAGLCLVATDEGRLIGTIVVEPAARYESECPYFAKSGVASVHQMAVSPRDQGKGVGSRLLEAAETWARDNGFHELALDTAEPARHLVEMYSRRGYACVGSAQGEGKSYRSVFMSKKLDQAMKHPPEVLDGAKVLEYAVLDSSVRYTGALHLYHGDTRVGPVPCLAICRDPGMKELLLFHCDENWNVLGAQAWNSPDRPPVTSVDGVKERAETFYAGISSKWLRYDA